MAQYIYLGTQNLSGLVYSEIKFAGGYWDVKQEGAASLFVSSRKDVPRGSNISFSVCFATESEKNTFLAYLIPYSPMHPDFDEAAGADIALYIRSSSYYYRVWGVVVKAAPMNKHLTDYLQYSYDVICYLYSPYSYAAAQTINSASTSLVNSAGHVASSVDVAITCAYSSGNATNVTAAIADSVSLILAAASLSSEVWRLIGDENRILETYEDTITSATRWNYDTVGDGTFDTDHIELNNAESAYYVLSGPHPAKYPVRMTAALSLDSGGVTNQATIAISGDGVSWTTVLDQDDFESGSAEYVLDGSEYLTDIYVRFSCLSGTAGKKLNIGSIKFEVERWIESGAVPQVAAGATKTLTISATGGSLSQSGTFRPRQLFV